MQVGRKGTFYVTVAPPEEISLAQREFVARLVLHAASQFSFQGMEDWAVDLGPRSEVLGIAEEFHDLSGQVRPQAFIVYFGRLTDARKFQKLFQSIFADARVSAPRRQKPQDWMRAWRRHYKPVSVVRGALWIYPAWVKIPAARRSRTVRITPGQAFGTGTHETTMLCLEELVREVRGGREIRHVLDFGAGTGILSLGVLRLVHGVRAEAVEVDPVACEQLEKNARLNRAKLPVRRTLGREKKVDLIFANVLAPVLLEFRAELLARVAEGGVLILSGILAREVSSFVVEFARGTDLVKNQIMVRTRGDWATVVVRG